MACIYANVTCAAHNCRTSAGCSQACTMPELCCLTPFNACNCCGPCMLLLAGKCTRAWSLNVA
eukprot:scaffold89214_cov15-Tisochrysis_lutea.AAC.1